MQFSLNKHLKFFWRLQTALALWLVQFFLSLFYSWKDKKNNQYLIKIILQKDIQTYIQQTGLQEIPIGSQLVPDKEKNATFLPQHCCCHKSDYHLISPYNISSQSHIKVTRIKELITN